MAEPAGVAAGVVVGVCAGAVVDTAGGTAAGVADTGGGAAAGGPGGPGGAACAGGEGGAEGGSGLASAAVGTPCGAACPASVFWSFVGGGCASAGAPGVGEAAPAGPSAARLAPAPVGVEALRVNPGREEEGGASGCGGTGAARGAFAASMRCSSQTMMSCARSMASLRFSVEQLGESPIRLRLLTICGTNCALDE